jgi:hypothetical protein
MKALDIFAFGVRTARETWPIDPIKQAVTSPPITATDGPRECCASYAAVVETTDQRSIWKCAFCRRMFHVPHAR